MKKIIVTAFLMVVWGYNYSQHPAGLIFSEYIEGTADNKFLEIYNGTGALIDLSDYQVKLFANGATSPNNVTNLAGLLQKGGVLVLGNSASNKFTGSFLTATTCNFNGDDAIVLYQISSASNIDIFGRIGEDPGTAWQSGEISTINKTLVRKSTVTSGVVDNPVDNFPTLSSQWEAFATDDVSHLGNHPLNVPAISATLAVEAAVVEYYKGNLTIESSKSVVSVQLISIDGTVVEVIKTSADDDDKKDILIPGKKVASGVYIIVVTFEDNTQSVRKIIVK